MLERRVLLLSGPTASGKTELSLRFADILRNIKGRDCVEVINSDSVQMYKECNVVSNKLSVEQRNRVPHHLIDSISLSDEDTRAHGCGWFCNQVKQLLNEIIGLRGNIPLIVGGNGFYHESLFRGFSQLDSNCSYSTFNLFQNDSINYNSLEERKKRLNDLKNSKKSWEELYNELKSISPQLARGICPNNFLRLYRAFEKIYELQNNGQRSLDPVFSSDGHYDVRSVALYVDKLYLYDIIGYRCEKIICDGLLEETFYLLQQGLLSSNTVPYNSIGYRQAISFIEQCMRQKELDMKWLKSTFLEFVADYKTVTRNYAKKQYNWFRRAFKFDSKHEPNPLLPPLYIWLDLSNLFKTVLEERENTTLIEQSYEHYAQQLFNIYEMSREEYINVFNSEQNKTICKMSTGNSDILIRKIAQESNTSYKNANRQAIIQLDKLVHKLYIFENEQVLQQKLENIIQMFAIHSSETNKKRILQRYSD
jgi:tRNA dimethylallyltransferase